VVNFNPLTEVNFLRSNGYSRIKMFPDSTLQDVMQICKTDTGAYLDGYWYWNTSGMCGYNRSGSNKWTIDTNGLITCASLTTSGTIVATGYASESLNFAYYAMNPNVLRTLVVRIVM